MDRQEREGGRKGVRGVLVVLWIRDLACTILRLAFTVRRLI